MVIIKKKLLISTLTLLIIGTGVVTNSRVFAKGANSGSFSTLVQMIADKFNLNKNDVQSVFDQYKTDREKEMESGYEQYLTQAVTDGKITDAQKQLLLQKHEELQVKRQADKDNWKNMTPEQRNTAMQQEKQALNDWAKQNNIDPQYLFGGRGGRMGHMGGRKGGWFMK